jgi:hypothetical protein
MPGKKLFNKTELGELPVGFSEFNLKCFFEEKSPFKSVSSKFYQNKAKMKIRLIHKSVTRIIYEESIL